MGKFGGSTYSAEHDEVRLTKQLRVLHDYMSSGAWRSLSEISAATSIPEPSASARLRDLRKEKHGGWTVDRRSRGSREVGLWEYRLVPPEEARLRPKEVKPPHLAPVVAQTPAPVVISESSVEIPTPEQLAEFVAWLRPRWVGWKAAGGAMPEHGVLVCKWLADGAKR